MTSETNNTIELALWRDIAIVARFCLAFTGMAALQVLVIGVGGVLVLKYLIATIPGLFGLHALAGATDLELAFISFPVTCFAVGMVITIWARLPLGDLPYGFYRRCEEAGARIGRRFTAAFTRLGKQAR